MADFGALVPPDMADAYTRNAPYMKPGASDFNTPLDPLNELAFQSWATKNNVPFDFNAPVSDYDMRGFYKALQSGDPRAAAAVNPNDQRMHYPDVWKTPYHQSFSEGSQWAGPVAPKWTPEDKLISPGGRVLLDERAPTGGLLSKIMRR